MFWLKIVYSYLNVLCYICYVICVYSAAIYLASSAPDVSTVDTFNRSSTELNEWLSFIDHMIVQRVTVGDLSEICDLIVKLKVSAVNDVIILVHKNVVILL